MELGEKLRSARREAGLTQKQLCEGLVTRNMLSQIENGAAKPSMGTLTAFARRLGKSVSFFLEDTAVVSPNTQVMEEARSCYDAGAYARALSALEAYRTPDSVYDREKQLLETVCCLNMAKQALAENREGYAREWLEQANRQTAYCGDSLNRQRLLLLGQLRGEQVSDRLPCLDRELMLRASEATDSWRAAALLDACEDHSSPEWNLLRGKVWLAEKQFGESKQCLLLAESAVPEETASLLEECFRELGDYKKAYEYACKQR